MGKFILGLIVVLAVIGGTFFFGYIAGITASNGVICELIESEDGGADVCLVDGVRYVPEVTEGAVQ